MKVDVLIATVPRFGEGRRANDSGGILGLQGEIDEFEICLVILGADMLVGDPLATTSVNSGLPCYLKHLNTDEGIECLLKLGRDFSVVEKVHTDERLEAGVLYPFLRESFLFC